MSQEKIGLLILRVAMAGVYIYFGVSQLMDPVKWASVVPEWALEFSKLDPEMIVRGNGVLEVVLGAFLALGFWIKPVAAVLAIHLFVIAFGIGFTPTGIRDYGLAFATLSLAFLGRR